METLNCIRCDFRHKDNGNCTAVGGFCTAVTAAHCPMLQKYLDTGLGPDEVTALQKDWSDLCTIVGECGGIDRLRELAEADKDGRIGVLPCKVGDRLYEVTGRKTISVYKVRAIRVELFGLFIEWDIVEGFVWQSLSGINAGEIGKTVFLTREEAEKALEAMKDD
nr:MAG TPA: hypothetical protein [Caudoviricetes sp.]